eukprot:5571854-Amphidinium_carterae.1
MMREPCDFVPSHCLESRVDSTNCCWLIAFGEPQASAKHEMIAAGSKSIVSRHVLQVINLAHLTFDDQYIKVALLVVLNPNRT